MLHVINVAISQAKEWIQAVQLHWRDSTNLEWDPNMQKIKCDKIQFFFFFFLSSAVTNIWDKSIHNERRFILVHDFRGFNPSSVDPVCFPYIVAGVSGRGSLSYCQSRKQKRKEAWVIKSPFNRMCLVIWIFSSHYSLLVVPPCPARTSFWWQDWDD